MVTVGQHSEDSEQHFQPENERGGLENIILDDLLVTTVLFQLLLTMPTTF